MAKSLNSIPSKLLMKKLVITNIQNFNYEGATINHFKELREVKALLLCFQNQNIQTAFGYIQKLETAPNQLIQNSLYFNYIHSPIGTLGNISRSPCYN